MALYIGLMSGTSMDGVDAVLCDINDTRTQTLAGVSLPYPDSLLSGLHRLCASSSDEIDLLGQADRQVAMVFAQAVEQLLGEASVKRAQITAIGSHGQTVRHCPPAHPDAGAPGEKELDNTAFTLQIGDPNTLSAETGIDVVADFRRKDVALGGHGAPLVPRFHLAAFRDSRQNRALVNVGGIANISYLPAADNVTPLGFDTGPGNTLLDLWCLRHQGQPFDRNGQWAKQGTIHTGLLDKMLNDPYFKRQAPKSTGREYFNLSWLQRYPEVETLAPADVQATLLALTARTVYDAVSVLTNVNEAFLCGGGAFNPALLEALNVNDSGLVFRTTEDLGLSPQWVEGAAFAWLAWAFINKQPGNLPSVTGASREAVLGILCPA